MTTFNSARATPLYQQLCDRITEQIRLGEFSPGDQIPSEERLVEMYGISRVTVRSALKRLCDEHILVKRHGKGTFVALPVFVESFSAGGSFTKSCLQRGSTPTTKLVSCAIRSADDQTLRRLGLEPDSKVICVKRIRLVDDVATILEVDYFRSDYQFLLDADFANSPLSDLLFAHTGMLPRVFEDIFDVYVATKEHATCLGCKAGAPLLRVWQTVMGDSHQVLYCNEQYIVSERYKYAINYSCS